MMPIFFHLESHLWIAYTFFFNGLLLTILFRQLSSSFKNLSSSFEATIASSFFLSIAINGLLLLLLDVLELSFANTKLILPTISVILVMLTSVVLTKSKQNFNLPKFNWLSTALYLFVFVVLFYNGGLIEHLTDAWWHMSFANKIAFESTFSLSAPHLNMYSYRYYPPLWHGNLALLKIISGESLAVIWNSVTAWVGVIKVMCFYLLGLGVSKSVRVAFLSALLFILLPGVGDSYLRVSAWPSHIAYPALFSLIYLFFDYFDKAQQDLDQKRNIFKALLLNKLAYVFSGIILLLIVLFSHKAELVWFFILIFAYLAVEQLYYFFTDHQQQKVMAIGSVIVITAMFCCCGFFVVAGVDRWASGADLFLVYWIPTTFVSITVIALCCNLFKLENNYFRYFVAFLLILTPFFIINWHHLAGLFFPSLASGPNGAWQKALQVQGYFDQWLKVPGWHLQLREGLLYSGVVSIPLSLIMFIKTRSRVFLFTFAAGFCAFLLCASPYLYQWLDETLKYHSPWRISIVIFHPLVFAATISFLLSKIRNNQTNSVNKMSVLAALVVFLLVVFDSKFHFDKDLVALKFKHNSDQRNWSLFYSQRYVFDNSAIKYQNDIAKIKSIVEPKKIVFSDKATSYYLASSLPVYIANIHNHHGKYDIYNWSWFIDKRFGCYIKLAENKEKLREYFAAQYLPWNFSYIVLNKDSNNKHYRSDCWAFKNQSIAENIAPLADKIYQGQYLDVYKVKR